MTVSVLVLVLLALCGLALASRVALVSRVSPEGRALTAHPLPMVLCSWWREVETRPG